jgi:diguanylate cyclase (GGDEF)-like protein
MRRTLVSRIPFIGKARLAFGTLKGRLTAAVIVLVAVSSVLVAAVALEIASRDAVGATGRQQLNLLTSAASHLDAELVSKQHLLQLIAEEIPANAAAGLSMQETLARHPSLRSSFSDVVIVDAHGWLRADMVAPSNVGRGPYSDRRYFKDTLRLRRGVISEPIISTLSGKPIVLITEAILDRAGNVAYVVGGGIDLADPAFFGQIKRLHAGSTGYLFAITKDGLVLHHPDIRRLAQNVNHETGSVVASTKAAMDGWEGWTLAHNKQGLPGILTYKQMQRSGWILGSFFPADEAFSGITEARRYAWLSATGIAILAGLIGWATVLYLLKPLRSLRRHVNAVEEEQAEIAIFDIDRDDEVGALGRAFHSLSLKRERAEHRLHLLSQTDSLTGLGNRRQFDHEIAAVIDRAAEMQYSVAVGFLDIDHFKSINDTYGHAVGDGVLREFAQRLKANLRPTDQPFRLAGDEFVIVLERVGSADSVERLAARLIEAIRVPFEHEGMSLSVTTSLGFAITDPPLVQAGDLLQHADAALYRTKRAGRNGYTVKKLGKSPMAV